MFRYLSLLALVTVTVIIVGNPALAQDPLTRARALHQQVPLIDGHNDYPWALRGLDPGRDFSKAEISKPVPSLMTDIPRLRQGGLADSSGRSTRRQP